jgi:hypothetical protein
MNRFAPALRSVARELDLPPKVKAAILMEMAGDLEAAFDHHRNLGRTEEEAERLAEAAVLGSSEVVRRLGRMHRGSWLEWSERVGERLGGGADLVLVLLAVVPMYALAGFVTLRTLAYPSSLLAWPLLAAGVAVGALIAMEAGRILGAARGAGRQLPLVLALSVVAPALGLLAAALEVHSAAGALAGGIPEAAIQLAFVEGMTRAGTLLLVGLLIGLAGALSWFVLLNRDAVRVRREVDAILEDSSGVRSELQTEGVIPLIRRRRA